MTTAVQAFSRFHQHSIAKLLIAHGMSCELFASGLVASRFAPVVRFGQSFHLGIHAHIRPHYGMAMDLSQRRSGRAVQQGRQVAEEGSAADERRSKTKR
jgi:hypothetical protein